MARVLLRSELATAIRRSAAAGNAPARSMSSGSSSQAHDIEETIRWRNITAVAYVACLGYGIYQLTRPAHHAAHDRPAYSYLRIRNKEFPWGPCGLFEWDCKTAADAK